MDRRPWVLCVCQIRVRLVSVAHRNIGVCGQVCDLIALKGRKCVANDGLGSLTSDSCPRLDDGIRYPIIQELLLQDRSCSAKGLGNCQSSLTALGPEMLFRGASCAKDTIAISLDVEEGDGFLETVAFNARSRKNDAEYSLESLLGPGSSIHISQPLTADLRGRATLRT